MSETVFCPNCGTRISARARFCPSCGARQDEFQVEPAPGGADTPAEPPPATPAPDEAPPFAPDWPREPPRVEAPPPAAPPPARDDAPPPSGAPVWPHPPIEDAPPAVVSPAAAAPPPPDEAVLPRLRGDSVDAPAVEPKPWEPLTPPPAPAPRPVESPPEPPPRPAEYSQPAATPPPRPSPAQERIGRVDPHAAELSGLLRERLALPGIVAAAIAAAAAAGIVLAAGLLIALVSPDVSLIGLVGVDANVVTEAFRQAAGTLFTPMLELENSPLIESSRRIHPLLFLVIPLGAVAWSTRWQLHRTEGAAPLARLGWALLVAFPFGLEMLAFAIVGGNSEARAIDVSAGNAFALGVLWGLVGGLIGAATKLPWRDGLNVPSVIATLGTAILAALRPLAALLLTCTAIALVGWLVQVGANSGNVRADRSAPTALIEETVYLGEHGIHLTALAAGARFRADSDGALGVPFPVERPNDLPGDDGAFRIFAYNDVLPAYVLLPALVLLLGLTALAMLYAGFAAAKAVHATSFPAAAGWGAVTGPAWAVVMAVLAVLAGGLYHGDADDNSVIGVYLLAGALLGAAGGALAVSGQASGDSAPADASS